MLFRSVSLVYSGAILIGLWFAMWFLIYLTSLFDSSSSKRIILSLPQLSGFYDECPKICKRNYIGVILKIEISESVLNECHKSFNLTEGYFVSSYFNNNHSTIKLMAFWVIQVVIPFSHLFLAECDVKEIDQNSLIKVSDKFKHENEYTFSAVLLLGLFSYFMNYKINISDFETKCTQVD